MLFEDREDSQSMAKEININFRASEDFRDFLYRKAGALDMTVSEMLRSSVLLAVPQIESIRGIARIQLEDMRTGDKAP